MPNLHFEVNNQISEKINVKYFNNFIDDCFNNLVGIKIKLKTDAGYIAKNVTLYCKGNSSLYIGIYDLSNDTISKKVDTLNNSASLPIGDIDEKGKEYILIYCSLKKLNSTQNYLQCSYDSIEQVTTS